MNTKSYELTFTNKMTGEVEKTMTVVSFEQNADRLAKNLPLHQYRIRKLLKTCHMVVRES